MTNSGVGAVNIGSIPTRPPVSPHRPSLPNVGGTQWSRMWPLFRLGLAGFMSSRRVAG